MHAAGRPVEVKEEKTTAVMKSPGVTWLFDVHTLCLLACLWYWFSVCRHQGDHDNGVSLGPGGGCCGCSWGWARHHLQTHHWLVDAAVVTVQLRLQHLQYANLTPCHRGVAPVRHYREHSIVLFQDASCSLAISHCFILSFWPQITATKFLFPTFWNNLSVHFLFYISISQPCLELMMHSTQ